MNKYIIILFAFILISCNNERPRDGISTNRIYRKDSFLIQEEFYKTGELKLEKHLSLDSINDGPFVEYRKNGKVIKWMWYQNKSKYPSIIVNYDSTGNFHSYKGTAFLSSGTHSNDVVIQVVNPPLVKYVIGFRDFKDGKVIKQEGFLPGIANGKGWITIKEHKYLENHNYYLYYYFMNNKNRIIDSSFVELLP